MDRQPVTSSNIAAVGYDPGTETLEVEFSNGGVYQYQGVSAAEHEAFINAGSIGSHFGRNIRSKYSGSKV